MKKILTHKILPFLGVFLFIFNILLVCRVSALSSSEVGQFNSSVIDYCKNLSNFNNYDYYIIHANNSVSEYGNLVEVFLFNDKDVKFYNFGSNPNGTGWATIKSTRIFGFYHYVLKVNYSSGSYSLSIFDEGVDSRSINNVITGANELLCPTGGYPIYANVPIYSDSNMVDYFYEPNKVEYPYIYQDVGDIERFLGSTINIYPGSYESSNTLDFSVYHVDISSGSYSNFFSCSLNCDSPYYIPMYSLDTGEYVKYMYRIFYIEMGNFVVGDTYRFVLTYVKSNGLPGTDVREVVIKGKSSEIGKETDEIKNEINSGFSELKVEFQESTDKIIESNNKTQEAIKEQTETSKNIFQKIGEMLSYINPFSENFFAYKLIDLLFDALKSLFIPSDEFFSNYFSELNDWFSDRFGFLYYPLELFFDLCNRFLSINFNEPVINIPEIREPFTNTVFISATQFNFNTLLEQNSLKTVHDIYLVVVDAIIYIGLVILLYNKYEEVMTK